MFGILATEDNLEEILSAHAFAEKRPALDLLFKSKNTWYLVTGYYNPVTRRQLEWTFFSEKRFNRLFDYDTEKINAQWTMLVMKPSKAA